MDLESLQKTAFDEQYKVLLKNVIKKQNQLCVAYDDLIVDCFPVDAIIGHYLYKNRDSLFTLKYKLKESFDVEEKLSSSFLTTVLEDVVELKEEFNNFALILDTNVSRELTLFKTSSRVDPTLINIYNEKTACRKILNELFWTMWSETLGLQETLEKLIEFIKANETHIATIEQSEETSSES